MISPMKKEIALSPYGGEAQDLLDRARRVLEQARACAGISAAEATLSCGSGLCATVRMGEVESIEYQRDTALELTVYQQLRVGTASTSDLSGAGLREAVEAACGLARYASEDECAGLADPDLLHGEYPDLALDQPWELSSEQAVELALEVESHALQADERIRRSEAAATHTYRGTLAYANSHGFGGAWSQTRHSMDCSVIAEEEDGMQCSGWYDAARQHNRLLSPAELGRKAAQRALARLQPRVLRSRDAPVLLEAPLASAFWGNLVRALLGVNLYHDASFLRGQLGKRIFPEHVQIREQPHLPWAMGSAPFDEEGVIPQQRHIICDGVLQGYFLDSYAARKLGMRSTGNAGGAHNLVIQPGAYVLEDLVGQMGTGLLVTELMGFGSNLVTGDYSQGAAGLWVEGGEVCYPVEGITVAGNLRQMFLDLAEVGCDVDTRGSIHTGSILLNRMTLAGT